MSFLASLTRRNLILLAALGSAGLFFGALFFQFVLGVLPCKMCYWQRWPHRIGILAALERGVPKRRRQAAQQQIIRKRDGRAAVQSWNEHRQLLPHVVLQN